MSLNEVVTPEILNELMTISRTISNYITTLDHQEQVFTDAVNLIKFISDATTNNKRNYNTINEKRIVIETMLIMCKVFKPLIEEAQSFQLIKNLLKN